MIRNLLLTAVLIAAIPAGEAKAAVSADQAARLKSDLMPLGGEKAG